MGIADRSPGRGWTPTRGILGIVAVTAAGPAVGLTLARLAGDLPSTVGPLARLTVGVVLYGAGLAAVAVGYLALTGRLGTLRPDRPASDPRRLRLIVGTTAGLVVAWALAVGGLAVLDVPFAGNALTSLAEEGLRVSLLLLAALSVLVIAPAEELLYRGVVQASLYDVTDRRRAVVLASVPFALAHLPTLHADTGAPPAVALSLTAVFGLSLVFGWLHARTDDLLVPAAVHGGYNGAVFCLLYLVGV